MNKYFKDLGYSINKEFCGRSTKMNVLRFRGEWVSAHHTKKDALLAAIFHDDERTIKIL